MASRPSSASIAMLKQQGDHDNLFLVIKVYKQTISPFLVINLQLQGVAIANRAILDLQDQNFPNEVSQRQLSLKLFVSSEEHL